MKSWRIDEDGKYVCDADCHSWGRGICTCGLHHHFLGQSDKLAWDNVKHCRHNDIIHFLLENSPPKVTECRHKVHLNDDCYKCDEEHQEFLGSDEPPLT